MVVDARRVKELFGAALDIAEVVDRDAYLDRECSDDAELRQRLDALLKAHESPASALQQPLAGEGTIAFVASEKPGTVVAGRYKLLESIGEGGMGTVWVAEQTEPVKRKVAIKLIKAGMDSRSILARFEAERQALALMDHPNIAKVLDGGMTDQGRPYFVMEYVKGVPITEYCDATRLSIHDRLQLFIQVCQAVQHAHQKGIIHRDLKPSNILVAPYDDKPVPKIIDFGLAKAMHQSLTERTLHTAHESVLGTPLYMSPEQAQLNNLDVDTRSDIYSLGVLLYELLTGTTPLEKQRFKQAAWDEVRRIIREEEPPRPSTRLSSIDTLPSLAAGRHTDPLKLTRQVKGELDWIVMKALEKDRTRRYETANGFARDIQRYLSDEVVEARPASAGYRLKKLVRRNKGRVLAAGLVFLALLAGVAVSTWQAVRAMRAEQLALEARQAEAERAEEERHAKELAEKKQKEAVQQQQRAEAAEKLASERLVQVEAEKKRANEEKQIAQAVNSFLQNKLLAQADTFVQANDLMRVGGLSAEAKLNPTIRELLDRAAKELAPDKIEANFPNMPLVQAQILKTVGGAYRGIGEAETGLPFLIRSLDLCKAKLGHDHIQTIMSMHSLGSCYEVAGKIELATPLFEKSLKLSKDTFGAKHDITLLCMHYLGGSYYANGRLDRAVPIIEETYRLTKDKYGPKHVNSLVSLHALASALRASGQLDKALPLSTEVVTLMKNTYGPDHPNTLGSMENLAEAYRAGGKLSSAISLHEETLKLRLEKLGADHPNTLASMSLLAGSYLKAGKTDRAMPLFEDALNRARKVLGPDHPSTLGSMGNLAAVYRAAGKLDQALPLYEELLKLKKAKLGADHPDTLQSMNNLAVGYWSAQRFDDAIRLFEQLLPLQRAKLGADHPSTLMTLTNLGVNYRDAGRLPEAIATLEDAVARIAKLPPASAARLRLVPGALAAAYDKAGRHDKAEQAYRESLADAIKQFGKDHRNAINAEVKLATNLLKQSKFADAEPLLRHALAVREKATPDTWTTFNTQSMLGAALLGQKKYADAEPLLVKGYEGIKARERTIPPQGSTRIPEALDRLIQLYTETSKPDEVKKWQGEKEKISKTPEKK